MTRTDLALVRWLIAGGTTAIIYFAHPLWLPGVFPIILYFLWLERRRIDWLAAYASGILFIIVVVFAMRTQWSAGASETWLGPPIGDHHPIAAVRLLFNQVYLNFTGAYYFGTVVHAGRVTTMIAWTWMGVLAAATLRQMDRVLTRTHLVWSHVLFASISSTLIANWVLLEWRDPRYVLALNAPLVFLAGVEFFDLIDRTRVSVRHWRIAMVIVLALQAVAINEFANYTYMWWTNSSDIPSESRTLRKVIDSMRSRGVTHAFAMNALLQWTITFYSDETVIARWKADRDRYPPYIAKIDRAVDRGDPVAIVGYVGYTYGLERMVGNPDAIVSIDGKYFVYVGPSKDLLRKAGFEFR